MSTDRRTIEVILSAKDSGYTSTMARAAASTRAAGGEVKRLSPLAAAAQGKLGGVALGLGIVGVAAAGAMTMATIKTMEFDRTMSKSYAAVRGTLDATIQRYGQMRDAALEAGRKSVYTSVESASAMTELLKAGRSASQVIGGELSQSLNLAAADGMDLTAATAIMASSMTVFGRTGATAASVADTLAAGAGLAQGGVGDLGEALKYAGSQAANSNMTIQETTGLLATLANNGMQGSMAGTALAGIMRNLKTPVKEGASAMEELNFEVYDAQGSFKGMTPLLVELAGKLDGMNDKQKSEILSKIFDVRALNAALPLLREASTEVDGGTNSLEKMNAAVDQSGFAAGQAATMLDNLSGDVKMFSGAFEVAMIGGSDASTGFARDAVRSATGVLTAYNRLPSGIKSALSYATAGLAGVTLAGAGLIKAAEYGKKLRDSLVTVGMEGKKATRLVKGIGAATIGIGAALAVGAVIWGHFAAKAQESDDRIKDMVSTFEVLNGTATGTSATLQKVLEQVNSMGTTVGGPKLGDLLDKAGLSAADATKAIAGTDAEFTAFLASARSQVEAWKGGAGADWLDWLPGGNVNAKNAGTNAAGVLQGLRDEQVKSQKEAERLSADNNSLGTSYTNLSDAQTGAAKPYKALAAGTSAVAQEVEDAAAAVKAYITQLFALRDAQSGVYGSESAAEGAIDSATAAIDKKTAAQLKGKDITEQNNESVRKANEALRGIADQHRNYGAALMESGKSEEYANAQMDVAAAEMMQLATQWGLSKEEALQFTSAVTGVPVSHITELTVKGARKAEAQVGAFEDNIKGIPKEKVTEISAAIRTGSLKAVKAAIAELPEEQQLDILTELKDAGFKGADKELDSLTKRTAKKYNINLDGKTAKARAQELIDKLAAIKSKTVTVTVVSSERNQRAPDKEPGRAGGGPVWGAGTATSDSINARLSNGEHVIPADEVESAGGQNAIYRMRAGIRSGAKFADGGAVGFAKGGAAKKQKAKDRKAERKKMLEELAKELRRGEIQESLLGGSGLSIIDEISELSKDTTNYSTKERKGLAAAASKYEPQIIALNKKLADANDKVSELQQISDQVASSLNKFDLASAAAKTTTYTENSDAAGNTWYTEGTTGGTAGSMVAAAQARAASLKEFSSKLSLLQKAGASAAVLNDIASLGSEVGLPVIDEFLANGASLTSMNQAYADIQTYSNAAGQAITEASYPGGLAMAKGLATGLESELTKIGGALAEAMAKALGMKVVGGKLEKRAQGGPINANQPYIVNENGAEVLVTSRNGFMLNQRQALGALAGGGMSQSQVDQLAAAFAGSSGGITINGMSLQPQNAREADALSVFMSMAERIATANGRN